MDWDERVRRWREFVDRMEPPLVPCHRDYVVNGMAMAFHEGRLAGPPEPINLDETPKT